jgi:hypothetical protein
MLSPTFVQSCNIDPSFVLFFVACLFFSSSIFFGDVSEAQVIGDIVFENLAHSRLSSPSESHEVNESTPYSICNQIHTLEITAIYIILYVAICSRHHALSVLTDENFAEISSSIVLLLFLVI